MTVVFAVLATGKRVERVFDSYYKGMMFVNKVRHSKKVRLISYG